MVSTKHCCWGECKRDSRYQEKWPKTLKKHDESDGSNGVDRPARLSCACFSLNKRFALTGMSLTEHPFLYEMSGSPFKFSFSAGLFAR